MDAAVRIRSLLSHPGVVALVAAVAIWILILSFGQVASGISVISASLTFASFYVLVGVAQMIVISVGPGNIDLSIPGVMVLSAFAAMGIVNGGGGNVLLGLAAGLSVGVVAGTANVILIQAVRIPPMVATLATGFVLQSIASASSSLAGRKPSEGMSQFFFARPLGIPAIAWISLAVTLVVLFLYERTRTGRSILAVGQSIRAARLAGVPVAAVSGLAFMASAIIAGCTGIGLATISGGASLNMASDFLLMSIAVAILGGTAVSGGKVAPLGLWSAALLLQLIVVLLNVLGAPSGIRHAATGLVIIGVLLLVGRRTEG